VRAVRLVMSLDGRSSTPSRVGIEMVELSVEANREGAVAGTLIRRGQG